MASVRYHRSMGSETNRRRNRCRVRLLALSDIQQHGTKILFTDEWGGGGRACRRSTLSIGGPMQSTTLLMENLNTGVILKCQALARV